MGLFRHLQTLLLMKEQSGQAQTGPGFVVLPVEQEGDGESHGAFRAFVDVGLSGGGGSPSVKVLVETSHDGSIWVPVVTLQITSQSSVSFFEEIAALGPLVRARTMPTGNPAPQYVAVVKLAGDHPFRLLPVPASGTPGSTSSTAAMTGG